MGKYGKFERRLARKEKGWKIHPIWRGIGCLLLILIPIISYAGAVLLVEANRTQRWLVVPTELAQSVNVPVVGNIPYLGANLAAMVLLMLVGFGIVTIVYSMVYRMVGPSRYGPMDAPPLPRRPKRR